MGGGGRGNNTIETAGNDMWRERLKAQNNLNVDEESKKGKKKKI